MQQARDYHVHIVVRPDPAYWNSPRCCESLRGKRNPSFITVCSPPSSARPPQCWRAGWTTPGSWSLLNPWPACLSSNTAWNGCWHSWGRCSRSPCTAPHEGAREQQWPQPPPTSPPSQHAGAVQQERAHWSLAAKITILMQVWDSDCSARSLWPDICCCFSFLLKRLCVVESNATTSRCHIWVFIWTFMESQHLKSGLNTKCNLVNAGENP